jgi:hypothetical protein
MDIPQMEADLNRATLKISQLEDRLVGLETGQAALVVKTQQAAPQTGAPQIDNFIRNGDIAHSWDTYFHAAPVADDTRFEAWSIYRNSVPVAAQQLKEDSVYSGVLVAASLALPDAGRSDTPNVDPDWKRSSGYVRLGSTSTIDFPLPSNIAYPGRILYCILIIARYSTNVTVPGRLFAGIWDNTAGQRNWLPAGTFTLTVTPVGAPAATVSSEYYVIGTTDYGRTIGSTKVTVNRPTDPSFISNSVYEQLSWSPVAGVIQWDVYRKTAGVIKRIAQTSRSQYFDQGQTIETVGAYPAVDETNQIAYTATRPGDLDNLPVDGVASAWKIVDLAIQVPTTYNMGNTTDKQWLRIGFDQALTGADATRGCLIDLVGLSYADGAWAHNPDDLKALQQPISGPNGSSQGGAGTGGGGFLPPDPGGGGIRCITLDMPVRCFDEHLRQHKIEAQDLNSTHRVLSYTSVELGVERIQTTSIDEEECVRLETYCGIVLKCSLSEPVIVARFDRDGRKAGDLKVGDNVLVYLERERRVVEDTLKSVARIGKRQVVKISLVGSNAGNHKTFMAGEGPGSMILHNVKPEEVP